MIKAIDTLRDSRAIRAMFALVLTFGLCVPVSLFGAKQAYAAGDVYLDSPGTSIPYGGYETTYMWAEGAPAYCGQPALATPASGNYIKESIDPDAGKPGNDHEVNEIYADLYFGWGGPGFDASLYPSIWYDGSPMTAENYWAVTHIILSDSFACDANSALAGTDGAFQSWCKANILSFYGGESSTQWKMFERMWQVPQDFKNACFMLRTGSDSQIVLGFSAGGWIDLDKDSANTSITNGNSCYDLTGAQYGIFSDGGCTNRVATLTCDGNGYAKSGYLSKGTYYVKEVTAGKGYALDKTTYTVSVGNGSTTRVNGSKVFDQPQNDPVGILLGKYDGQKKYVGENNLPQGAATLAGAEFTVTYYDGQYQTAQEAQASGAPIRTWVLKTDNDGYCDLVDTYVVAGDTLYRDSSGNPTVPLGTLLIQETKAPDGYLLNNEIFVRNITSNQVNTETVNTFNMPEVPDQVKRGDLEFVKVVGATNTRLANIPFKLTSETTGESHILVTDENGYASTAAKWNAHTNKTNFNDTATEETYDSEAGIWFADSEQTESPIAADNSLGALPYDTYTLEELPCEANKDYTLVKQEHIVIKRNDNVVDLKMLSDMAPYISTSAKDDMDGDKLVAADPDTVIADTVEYTGLEQGKTYTMVASLMDKTTGQMIGNATGKTIFTVSHSHSGNVEVKIPVNTLEYAGHELVVYEELFDADNKVIADHKEIDSTEQNIRVLSPELGTNATDKVDGDKLVVTAPTSNVVDTVSYKNLVPGKEYTVSGKLMVKGVDDNGNVTEEALVVGGNPVTATAKFTPTEKDGEVSLTFTFPTLDLEGKTLVAFEEVTKDGVTIAVHADINDEAQTVEVVSSELATTATDTLDSDKLLVADPDSSFTDVISYHNLIQGQDYTFCGLIMNKTTHLPVVFGDKSEVTTDEVQAFMDDLCDALGIERIQGQKDPLADLDIDNNTKNQINNFVNQLVSGSQQNSNDNAGADTTTEDTTNTSTTQIDKVVTDPAKVIDYEKLSEVLQKHSKVVSHLGLVTKGVTPTAASGSVTMTFDNLDTKDLANTDTVVFELALSNDRIAASHADFTDEGQSVQIIPTSIGTKATDKTDGDQTILRSTDTVVVDTVSYTNVIPGKEYVVKGKLVDKKTGKTLLVNDKEVVASTTFTPNTPAGTVDLEFSFDSTGLKANDQLVAFEEMYKDDLLVATHADINDEAQTVTVGEVPGAYELDKTGDQILPWVIGIGIAVLVAGGLIAYVIHNRKKAALETEAQKEADSE